MKFRLSFFAFMLVVTTQSYATTVSQLVIPQNSSQAPIYRTQSVYITQPNQPIYSIEDKINNFKMFQRELQGQLNYVNQQIAMYQQFSDAQKALQLKWRDVNEGQAPTNLLPIDIGNKTKESICRAKFQRGTYPGVVVTGGCYISYGGNSLIIPNYEVLSSAPEISWQAFDIMNDSEVKYQLLKQPFWNKPSIPVMGGYERGMPLFICRANYNNVFYVGKLVNQNCNIAVGPREIRVSEFQLMFAKKPSLGTTH